MGKPTIYIHTNHKQYIGALLSEFSFRRASKNPDAFETKIIHLDDFSHLLAKEGQPYLHRKDQERHWTRDQLQSFTLLRFLPPQLMGYQGRALLVDPDVFACSDVNELLSMEMNGRAIYARPRESPENTFHTSVMLLDCAKLSTWKWEQWLDRLFSKEMIYNDLMILGLESEGGVGSLAPEWNHFDELSAKTKLLHNTGQPTQPWKTGLPVDYIPRRTSPKDVYQPHPDSKQEEFFFELLADALRCGVLTEKLIRDEMKQDHLRHDVFDKLAQYQMSAAGPAPC